MKNNQNGFSIVEILLVAVVVGLLGTIGWLVYDRYSDEQDASVTTEQRSGNEQKPTSKEQSPPLTKTTLKTFEISYDSAWKINRQTSEDNACGNGKTYERLELAKDQKAITIIANDCGKDFASDVNIEYGVVNDKVVIQNKDLTLCAAADNMPFCSAGDGKLLVAAVVGEYDEAKNNYFIQFSNEASEDISSSTLADIYEVIESIKLSR